MTYLHLTTGGDFKDILEILYTLYDKDYAELQEDNLRKLIRSVTMGEAATALLTKDEINLLIEFLRGE